MTITIGDPPKFASARGTVHDWFDREHSYRVFSHFTRIRYEVQIADIAARRAAHPEWSERQLQGYPPPSPDMPSVWEPEVSVNDVLVLPPERSRAIAFQPHDGRLVPTIMRIVTPAQTTVHHASRVGDKLSHVSSRPTTLRRRDDYDAYCYGPHDREALALLQPRCFFHGREPVGAEPLAMTVLGRPGELSRLKRMIPLNDPRILGDEYNPTVFDEAEETEVIVDQERGVVLEWRGLFDGAPYERHVFTRIAFEGPMEFDDVERDSPPGR